jgi:aryl-alcohol dehydrogenase-like predicted oxidoreductase
MEHPRMKSNAVTAAQSGTFLLGGEIRVHRLGLGAMRVTGKGIWGPPDDRREAIAVLRRSVELEVNFIDTAESYGPEVSEELIGEALYPYPPDLVIATKGGFDRSGPNKWEMNARPERLRQELDGSLKRLRLEQISLYQLHRIDPKVPEADQFGTLQDFQRSGKIRHIGLSEVNEEQIERARRHFPVVSVQNRYNVGDREWEKVLEYCERHGIAFIPWYPLQTGTLVKEQALSRVAGRHQATALQIALAWLLRRSPVMLPIPGTSKVKHLEENVGAAAIDLSQEDFDELSRVWKESRR